MLEDKTQTAAFAFLDLETTGLNPYTGKILEIALIITDADLKELDTFRSLVHIQGGFATQTMPPNVVKMHRESGLLPELDAAIMAGLRIGCGDVEADVVRWLRQYPPLIMAGFSAHFDKEFLRKHMPVVLGLFGHQIMDVSAIKIGARFWATDIPEYEHTAFGGEKHRALPDCREALGSLRQYKDRLFIG